MRKQRIVLVILLVLFVAGPMSPAAAAKTPTPTTAPAAPSSSAGALMEGESEMVASVEYALPYPGILPDHPLFPLKKLRDWVFERLITDPLRKTEFYILQADKRLAMALAFMEKAKPDDALAAVGDEEAFMRKAIQAAQGVKAASGEVPGYILDRFERSIAKHIEVLGGHAGYSKALEAFQKFQQEASALK